jgi:Cof subfamily protein (haloacid dehalogenase superfamily)
MDYEKSDAVRRPLSLMALDLDGTLLRSVGSISVRTRQALVAAQAAGLTVMSVTARPPRRVRQIADSIGLSGLAICSNGAVLYDLATDSLLRETILAVHVAVGLVGALREGAPGVRFAVEAGSRYGCEHAYAVPLEHGSDATDPLLLRADALALCQLGVTKLIVQHPEWQLETLLDLAKGHAGPLASVTHSGSNFVEIAATSVSKALALEAYCGDHMIAREAVIAFGDMPNDLPMLRWAGHGVAVANAHPEVRAVADETTTSNNDDGVARVLERLAESAYVLSA